MRTTSLVLVALAAGSAFCAAELRAQVPQRDVLVLSPEAGERISADAVLIAVSFVGNTAAADAAACRVEIDGRDITAGLEIRGTVVTWRPVEPLAGGPHRVVVTTRDSAATTVAQTTWSFTTTAADTAHVKSSGDALPADQPLGGWWLPHGTLIMAGTASSLSGAGADLRRQEDLQPNLWLNAGGALARGWRYTTNVHVSGDESADQQPINRYRFDLRAPFFRVSLGDVHPFMQGLILAGRRVRGVQGELRAGPLRLSVVSGQSRRAIPALLNTADGAVLRTGTFGQNLFAVRPAIGSGDRFQAGLTVLRVRDDVGSIQDVRIPGDNAAARSANAPPKDNLVAGFDLTWRLLRGRVLLQYENGISLLANDISGGPLTRAGLDSIMDASGNDRLDLDPAQYKDWFILNASVIPLDPRGFTNVAHQARASMRAGTHILGVEWHSVGGSYYTLGYPALQRDRRGIRVDDSFTMVNDALVASAGFEQDRDNLDDAKSATTTSSAGFAMLSWQRSPDALLLTGSVRLGARSNDLGTGQEGAVDESNRALSGGVGIPLPLLSGLRTRLNLNTSYIERSDPTSSATDTRDIYYLAGIEAETPERTSDFSLVYGINRSELGSTSKSITNYQRLLVSGRHQLSPRIAALLDGSYTAARADEGSAFPLDYNRAELLGGGEFQVLVATVLTFNAGVISYGDKSDASFDTRETVIRLSLRRAF